MHPRFAIPTCILVFLSCLMQYLSVLFSSLDLSGMLQGKIQVGYSSTAENAAARKAFLVSVTLLLVSQSVIIWIGT